jgi:steroid delta-isomerase-like uncharacterized protein
MSNNDTFLLIQSYYDAFNEKDMKKFMGLLSEDVVHDINQGDTEIGKPLFEAFMNRMNEMYSETVHDVIILTSRDGLYASAKFHLSGMYMKTHPGLPQAKGQTYVLNAGAFFEVENKKIIRVSNYYNLNEWIKQVST